ncbi:tRNA (guanine(26)-N(2))-dimethyltransferase [Trichinella spiralis]|uniref:tRNA (Guanine(26)-N(2))-dimethyltransferase n=1 Tax=Trichinella spiralis TaxID=6334 RepID=A0ABR3KT01_TRISP
MGLPRRKKKIQECNAHELKCEWIPANSILQLCSPDLSLPLHRHHLSEILHTTPPKLAFQSLRPLQCQAEAEYANA